MRRPRQHLAPFVMNRALALAVGTTAIACDQPFHLADVPPPLVCSFTSVAIVPLASVIEVGARAQLSAAVSGSSACSPYTVSITTPVTTPTIATIDGAGVATGVSIGGPIQVDLRVVGNDPIQANAHNATITVVAATVSTVAITPAVATILVGQSQTFQAIGTSAAGLSPVPGAVYTWNSTNPAIATISATGVATAVAPGTTTIQASTPGSISARVGNATLTVQDPTACLSPVTVISENFDAGDPFTKTLTVTGGAADSTLRQSTAGNPNGYRRMTHTLPSPSSIVALHLHPATYSLSQGAINHIEYGEDRIQYSPPFVGAQIGSGIAIKQGATTYALSLGNFFAESWNRFQKLDIRATDFPGIDFSVNGAPIQFGYLRSNSSSAGGATTFTSHGIDNVTVRICR